MGRKEKIFSIVSMGWSRIGEHPSSGGGGPHMVSIRGGVEGLSGELQEEEE